MGNIEASRRSCRCRLEHTALIEADINAIFLHLLYALASPSISILYAPEPHTFPTRGNRRFGEHVDGHSGWGVAAVGSGAVRLSAGGAVAR